MFNDLLTKNGLTIERLRRFCEIVEAGSIAKAVEQNDREQPVYSRDLKALEDYFEEDLFRKEGASRSGKALGKLTLRGDLLHKTALRLFRDLERIFNYSEATDVLVVGADECLLHYLVVGLLGAFSEKVPESRIRFRRLELDEMLPAVANHEVHFAIAGSSILSTEIEEIASVPIGSMKFQVLAAKELIDQHPGTPPEKMIHTLPVATLSATEGLLGTLGIEPKTTFDIGAHLDAALWSKQSAAFLPDQLDGHDFQELLLPEPCRLNLSLAYNTIAAEENPYIASVASDLTALLCAALQ
jgi:DNA-binding transcriptional LysR family regulator